MADDIRIWLTEIGLGEYIDAFVENEVELNLLHELTNDDLKDLGVAKLGHRKALLSAITQMDGASGDPTEAKTPVNHHTRIRQAERRQLTVMFCDIVGSTSLSGKVDPEVLRDIITIFQNLVAGAVTKFDGQVAKYMGDGVLCYFGWPKAHEDDAKGAVRAGLEIIRALKATMMPGDAVIEARIGISTGLVVVGDLIGSGSAQEEAVVGETPNIAARLQGVAAPGQVVIGPSTRSLLGRTFEVEELGLHELKGVAEKMPAFSVVREAQVETRFEAQSISSLHPMIGREHELNLISDRWNQAVSGGGQLLLLSGEPGIGKSRVAKAVSDAASQTDHIRISYQCSPYHEGSPLYPTIQQLRISTGITESDSNEEQLDKIEDLLVGNGANLIASLLGADGEARYGRLTLSPTQQRANTLQVLIDELVALSRAQPVLFVIEDAHWIDATTLELIEIALDRIDTERVLILVTARPGFIHSFAGLAAITKLEMNRLAPSQIADIIRSVAGDTQLTPEVCDDITARSDGVPLFAEELTKTILASAQTTSDETGSRIGESRRDLVVPASLNESLMARLDQNLEAKEVAQIASCIGREFSYGLLARIAEKTPSELDASLKALREAELILRRGTDTEDRFMFKHALVTDTAYGSLLISRRTEIHARIADALSEDGDAPPEDMARHLAGAGRAEQASKAWDQAGDMAMQRAALREAAKSFRSALEQLAKLSESRQRDLAELRILTRLGSALVNVEGWASVEGNAVHKRAKDLADLLDTSAERVSALVGIWLYHTGRGEHDQSAAITTELQDIAKQSDDRGLLLQAHHAAWPNTMVRGLTHKSAEAIDAGLAIYDEELHRHHGQLYMGHDPAVCGHTMAGPVKWALGHISEAERHIREASDLIQRRGDMSSRIHSLILQGSWHCTTGDHQRLLEIADELGQLARTHHLRAAEVNARVYRGWALVGSGDVAGGLKDLEAGVEAWRGSGARIYLGQRLSLLGETHSLLGKHFDARKTFDAAFEVLNGTKEFQFSPEMNIRRGHSLLAADAGDRKGAEHVFLIALAVARRQKAPTYELRAANSLAELWADKGSREQSAKILTDAVDHFPSHENCSDLEKAKEYLKGVM